jgi:hypothetical protein
MVLRCHGSKHSLLLFACCQKAKCYHNPSWHYFRNITLASNRAQHIANALNSSVDILIKYPKSWVSSVFNLTFSNLGLLYCVKSLIWGLCPSVRLSCNISA